jgi:hypothetical protein
VLNGVPDHLACTKAGDRRGGECEPNEIILQKPTYVTSSISKAKTLQECDEHTNQQCRNDPLDVMNVAEKEWDQLNTRLARYRQNCEWTSGWKSQSDIVWWSRTLSGWGFLELKTKSRTLSRSRWTLSSGTRHCPIGGLWKTRFSLKIRPFILKIDSWAIVLQIEWNLDTRVTLIQGTGSP